MPQPTNVCNIVVYMYLGPYSGIRNCIDKRSTDVQTSRTSFPSAISTRVLEHGSDSYQVGERDEGLMAPQVAESSV